MYLFLDSSQFLYSVVQILLHLPQFVDYYFSEHSSKKQSRRYLDDQLALIFFAVWNFSSEANSDYTDYIQGLFQQFYIIFSEDATVLSSHDSILKHLFDNIGTDLANKCKVKVLVERDACTSSVNCYSSGSSFVTFKYLTVTIPSSADNTGLDTYLQEDTTFSTLSAQECIRCKKNTTGNSPFYFYLHLITLFNYLLISTF